MRDLADRILSVVLTLAAIAIAVVFVHREFHGGPARAAKAGPTPPEYAVDWKAMLPTGVLVGDSSAKVKVIVFADFECPYCRVADSLYRNVKKQFKQDDVAMVFIHFPLQRIHRFATPAARAAECADEQGRFAEFHDLVYDKQDSLGLKSWTSFAAGAGVRDTIRFAKCAAAATPMPRVDAGLALAKKLALHGTPTVIVNGWRFLGTPTEPELARAISASLAGKPVAGPGSPPPVAPSTGQ